MLNSLKKIFGGAEEAKRNALNEIEVLVHKEARRHEPHGFVVVSHAGQGIKNAPVAFVFPDYPQAPALDHRLILDLWEALRSQGYTPHHLAAYASLVSVHGNDHASDDVGQLAALPPAQPARMVSQEDTNERKYENLSSVPAFLRADRVKLVQSQANDPDSQLVQSYLARCRGLSEATQATAEIRFEQVVRNARARNETDSQVIGRLEDALAIMAKEDKRSQGEAATRAAVN